MVQDEKETVVEPSEDLLIQEGDIAADYIEKFLDLTDTDGDIEIDVRDGRPIVAVVGEGLGRLIGTRGASLDALQELTRMAVGQVTGERSRLIVDVGGHREQRREELIVIARKNAQRVRDGGMPVNLPPMNAFERKTVHDEVSTLDGVSSESEGEAPDRYVVIFPRHDE